MEDAVSQITPSKGGFLSRLAMDKTVGYVLLVGGLLMIILPVIVIFRVFTGVVKPPQVLNVEAPSIQMPDIGASIEIPKQLKDQGFSVGQGANQQPATQKIIPDEVFSFYINSGIYYLLMMFIASSGSKVALIGVHLIKDLKVKG